MDIAGEEEPVAVEMMVGEEGEDEEDGFFDAEEGGRGASAWSVYTGLVGDGSRGKGDSRSHRWEGEKQQQIPCGNDNKRSNNKSSCNDNKKSNNESNYRGNYVEDKK